MKKKPKDRHLDTPAEANRDKHINFTALERGETDPADITGGRLNERNNPDRRVKNRKSKKR
jgi:hypothetical protein